MAGRTWTHRGRGWLAPYISPLVFIFCSFASWSFCQWVYLMLNLCLIIWQIRLLTESVININYTMILKILYHRSRWLFKMSLSFSLFMKKHLNIFSYKCYFNWYIIPTVGILKSYCGCREVFLCVFQSLKACTYLQKSNHNAISRQSGRGLNKSISPCFSQLLIVPRIRHRCLNSCPKHSSCSQCSGSSFLGGHAIYFFTVSQSFSGFCT